MVQIRSKQSCFRFLGQIHFGDNINDDVGLNVLGCRVDILGTYSINNFSQCNYQIKSVFGWYAYSSFCVLLSLGVDGARFFVGEGRN